MLRLRFFFFYCSADHRDLHSFPTRRSSDLDRLRLRALDGAHRDVLLEHQVPPLEKDVDRKSTRLNSSHLGISYAVFCLKKKKTRNVKNHNTRPTNKAGKQQRSNPSIICHSM